MQTEPGFETDRPTDFLLRGMIVNAVDAVRRWEVLCHRMFKNRNALKGVQAEARDALDWIFGDLPTDRFSFALCCHGLEIDDHEAMANQIIDSFNGEACHLLEVAPRRLENDMWAVSPRPVLYTRAKPRVVCVNSPLTSDSPCGSAATVSAG